MDLSVLLENKLRSEWSAPEFVPYLTAERLEYAAKEFSTLETGIRVRVLLSLLFLSVAQLRTLWPQIENLFAVADGDTEEWVRIILSLVRRRLPPKQDIGITEEQSNGTSSSESNVNEDDFFVHSMKEIVKRLEGSPSGTKRMNSSELEYLSSDFVPLEWPYLCPEIYPAGVGIDNTNRHFTPRSRDTDAATFSSSNARPQPPQPQTPPQAPSSSSPQSSSELKKEKEEKVQRALMAVDPSKFQRKASVKIMDISELNQQQQQQANNSADTIPTNIPSSIQSILRDPENNKLTEESRNIVYQFYNHSDPNRPTTGTELIILCETKEPVDDTWIQITQVQLKLNYEDNTARRVKSKKKVKLKEGFQL